MENKGVIIMPDKTCPLCGSGAKAGSLDYGRFFQFLCKSCNTRYVLPKGLEGKIKELNKSEKQSLISEAQKCQNPLILHIYRDENKTIKSRCKPELR